ncbi:MAG: DeoR family transcriptional regulator [Luteitalea sp.]|nr:DeoR family transcriptional regulator [Luteitalea sp.]
MSASSGLRLMTEERRRRIVELVAEQKRATVQELVQRFNVSAVTIRADLDALAEASALVRSHGGALAPVEGGRDVPVDVKETLHQAEKARIGQAAARLVGDNETIILDSGTTTAEVARYLKQLNPTSLTVITNALNIAMLLANVPQVRVIMLGGILRQLSYSLVGPHAEQALRGLNAERLFLGVDGFDADLGPTTPDVLEAQLNALMIRVCRETTIVADSSKFSRRSLSLIAGIDSIQRVITDDGVGPETVAALRARNVEVIVV